MNMGASQQAIEKTPTDLCRVDVHHRTSRGAVGAARNGSGLDQAAKIWPAMPVYRAEQVGPQQPHSRT